MTAHDPSAWNASGRLAAHVLGVDAATTPAHVRDAVRAFTLDTIGVGIGGMGSPYARSLVATAQIWGEGHDAGVWASDVRLPAPHAAFLNAFLAHCQEFDCVHEGAVLHPFTVVVPTLLAEAERVGMDGATYIAACAAGVDVAVTLGLAATSQIRFFRPSTCGLFGAVAALARARAMNEAQTVDAFGYALAFASGTMQAHVEGTPALAVQVGAAARSAFWAADIAAAGLPGPRGSVDGPFGYLALFEASSALAPLLETLGRTWRAADVSWKPYPTGRAAHGGIDMALALRAQGVTAETLERLDVHAPPLILHLVARPIIAPLEVNYARLCLPYVMATALRRGTVTLADFTPDALADRETHALAARIGATLWENEDPAAFVPQRACAVLRDGREIVADVDMLPGAVARPLSRDQQLAKLAANIAYGVGAADAEARAAAIAAVIDHLETAPDAGVLSRLAQTGR
ncbi:MAG: MmgE/PrpD family protein [Alphaproteobacteria bacterium]|nr:MmgE/PrpD family protein [Alphaproteobacteria bacterium]